MSRAFTLTHTLTLTILLAIVATFAVATPGIAAPSRAPQRPAVLVAEPDHGATAQLALAAAPRPTVRLVCRDATATGWLSRSTAQKVCTTTCGLTKREWNGQWTNDHGRVCGCCNSNMSVRTVRAVLTAGKRADRRRVGAVDPVACAQAVAELHTAIISATASCAAAIAEEGLNPWADAVCAVATTGVAQRTRVVTQKCSSAAVK